MSRKVFANNMVAHVWAHASEPEGRSNNGNFWFEGDTIYSYSTPIARIHLASPRTVILMTCESFSVTTEGKHKNAVHRASDYGRYLPLFVVPFIGATGGRRHIDSPTVDHAGNLAHFESVYSKEIDRLARARTFTSTDQLERIAASARDYCRAFDLDEPAFAHPNGVATDVALVNEGLRVADSPERRAAREEAGKRAAAREAEKRAAWQAGAHNGWIGALPGGSAALRAVDSMTTLETSLGASVPLDHAIRAFRFVKRCRDRAETWRRNGGTLRVGHFQIDSIATNGDFHAGCHFIAYSEVERLATLLGLQDETGDTSALSSSH